MSATAPLVIVGAGPAGLAAAIEAARAGLPVTLLDEAPRIGGQIYRQPPRAFSVKQARLQGKEYARGRALREEFETVASHVEVRGGTSVLGIWGERELQWATASGSGTLKAEQLVLATGAYDRPLPFPGWTLPGVMTAGGAQAFVKTYGVKPGRRALIAGTGPLLLAVAKQLHESGVEVVAVLEAGRPELSWRNVRRVWGQWGLLKDAFDYHWALERAGIPVHYNHTVLEAHGAPELSRVTYAPIDPETWSPRREAATHAEVDLLLVGFGFVPSTELAVLAGCRHEYQHDWGGWVPVRDGLMRTSAANVFAAGDGTGVAGSLVAIEEGRVAGITAAEQAGKLTAQEATQRRQGPLRKLQKLAPVRQALDELSRLRPGLCELATPETVVCRCEEVRLSQVRAAVEQGARDLQSVKLHCRLGMGACQGRNCAPSMGMYLAHALGRSAEQVGRINPRPPVKPATLGALARFEMLFSENKDHPNPDAGAAPARGEEP